MTLLDSISSLAGYRKCYCTTNVNMWHLAEDQFQRIRVTKCTGTGIGSFQEIANKIKRVCPSNPHATKPRFSARYTLTDNNVKKISTSYLKLFSQLYPLTLIQYFRKISNNWFFKFYKVSVIINYLNFFVYERIS